jgi:hypothetical protein
LSTQSITFTIASRAKCEKDYPTGRLHNFSI